MKTFNRISLLLLTIITLASCETEYNFTINAPKKAILNDEIAITLTEENNNPIEEITLFVNGKEISTEDNIFEYLSSTTQVSLYCRFKNLEKSNNTQIFQMLAFYSMPSLLPANYP